MSLGSELKNSRESKKISLETVSKRTRIPVKYLEAIEENRFDVFPSQTYAKGFIRAYAKVVGMDAQVLTRQFNAEVAPTEVRIEPKNADAELEKTLGWRPTLDRPPVFRRSQEESSLNLEMVDESFSDPIAREPSVMRQKARAFRSGKWVKGLGQAAAGLAVVVLVGAGLYFTGKAISKIKWGGSKSAANGSANGMRVLDKYQHLILKGLDKSWVLVTMDEGQSSSEVDLDEGEVKTYQAIKSFKLKLGNAGGVDVQFNGKSLGVLGATGQVVEIQLPSVPGADSESQNDNS